MAKKLSVEVKMGKNTWQPLRAKPMQRCLLMLPSYLALLISCTVSADTRPHKDADPAKAQSSFIMSELKHMGWVCKVGAAIEWYCVSPDGKFVIGEYLQDKKSE